MKHAPHDPFPRNDAWTPTTRFPQWHMAPPCGRLGRRRVRKLSSSVQCVRRAMCARVSTGDFKPPPRGGCPQVRSIPQADTGGVQPTPHISSHSLPQPRVVPWRPSPLGLPKCIWAWVSCRVHGTGCARYPCVQSVCRKSPNRSPSKRPPQTGLQGNQLCLAVPHLPNIAPSQHGAARM